MKALLFINGEPPKMLPIINGYDLIACSDGAFNYLVDLHFPIERLDFISGDFDSHFGLIRLAQYDNLEIIHTPDQDKTDFEKSLEILVVKGVKKVEIYGGSGKEMDHFLGNLSVAFHFKDRLEIRFFDEFSEYFFIPNKFKIKNVKRKIISLFPFPTAEDITTKGLKWELKEEDLNMTSRIGTRNLAKDEMVSIRYKSGSLLIFVEK